MRDQQEVLRSPFDIETHRETFVSYLEVCIDREGTVHYAVPSHQTWLLRRYMEQEGFATEDDAWQAVPEYADVLSALVEETGCVPVWRTFYVGEPNKRQMAALRRLKIAGLYEGRL